MFNDLNAEHTLNFYYLLRKYFDVVNQKNAEILYYLPYSKNPFRFLRLY